MSLVRLPAIFFIGTLLGITLPWVSLALVTGGNARFLLQPVFRAGDAAELILSKDTEPKGALPPAASASPAPTPGADATKDQGARAKSSVSADPTLTSYGDGGHIAATLGSATLHPATAASPANITATTIAVVLVLCFAGIGIVLVRP